MGKDAQNKYALRLGFNFYQIPAGPYTFVVEFFLPVFNKVSVHCRSTSINVNHQVTKKLRNLPKTLSAIAKRKISSPEYLTMHLKCEGTSSSPTNGTGWLIAHGVSGTHSSVPPTVFDRMFTIGQLGTMLLEFDMDLHQNIA